MKMGTIGPVTPSRDNTEEPLAADASETFWFWETDLRTNRMFCSAELNAFLGVEPDQQLTPEESLQYVHSEDRGRVRAALLKPADGVQQAQVVYRVVTASGAVRQVRARAQFIMDNQNRPIRVAGLVRDITDEAETDHLLRSQSLVMQGMRDAVTIIDSLGVIRDTNSAAEAILGRSRKELVGATAADLHELTKVSAIAEDEIAESIQEKGYWHGEYSFVRPDGTRVYAETTSHPIVDPESGEIGRISITRDITERKLADEALRKSTHRLLEAHRIAKVGHWEYEAATDHVRMFGGIFDQFGVWGDESGFVFSETLATLHPADQERVAVAYKRAIQEGVAFDEVYRSLSEDEDSYVYIHGRGEPIRDDKDNITGLRGTILDVTEQRTTAEELRKSELRLLRAHRIAKISHWETDTATWCSKTYGDVLSGLGLDGDVSQEEVFALIHPDDAERVRAALEFCAKEGVSFDETYRVQDRDDSIVYMHAVGETVCNEAGKIVSIRGTTQDISERVRAEQDARASEDQTRAILENVADAVLTIDEDGIILLANRAFETVFGYSMEEIKGRPITVIMPESYRSLHTGSMNRYLDSGISRVMGQGPAELEAMDKDGRVFPIELTISEAVIGSQRLFIGSIRDISERKFVEEQLMRSSERLHEAHRIANLGHWDFDVASQMFQIYGELYTDFEFAADQSGTSFDDMNQTIHPDDFDCAVTAFERALADGTRFDETYRVFEADGEIVHIRAIGEVTRDEVGNVVSMRGVTQNVTQQKEADEALRQIEERYALAAEYGKTAVWEIHPEAGMIYADKKLPDLIGVGGHEPAKKAIDWLERVPDEEKDRVRQAMEPVFEGREKRFTIEHRGSLADGTMGWFRDEGFLASAPGEKIRVIGTTSNITERKVAEQQLQQAQKMEAVGQLTGGIAHDFNNLLAVISGNLELARERVRPDRDTVRMLETGIAASQRGAELTARLLAFSRRQMLMPQPTDINELTGHMLILGQRTLGEAVEVSFEPVEGAWWAQVDPSQLENALLNLAINARDAMPDGGTLTIRTENISTTGKALGTSEAMSAGDYVLVEVADTGAGMSEDIREKVFEPFFTTKEVGEGSGLGLSMVYGFAKQSGGHVDIESTLGEGTTIRLYLPRTEPTSQDVSNVQPAEFEVRSSGETVLIVEDDPHVRELAVSLVVSLGYTVLQADEAASALEIMESGTHVDLLLSDVILGKGMNGVELANQVRESCPKTKVLLMSGYAREAFTEEDGLEDKYELISKPFRLADLAKHIEVLLH